MKDHLLLTVNLSVPLNVLEFAISSEATFVSRTFAGSQTHMQEIFTKAFDHKGFSFVEVIAPCRTFEGEMPLSAFSNRLIDINSELAHDRHDKKSALARASLAFDYDENDTVRIPIGIFWEKQTSTFEDRVAEIKKLSGTAPVTELLECCRIKTFSQASVNHCQD